jgi:hypothetical protein
MTLASRCQISRAHVGHDRSHLTRHRPNVNYYRRNVIHCR